MVPEPPLEERLLLGGIIRGLLPDVFLHRVRDLKPVAQSTRTPPVSHSSEGSEQIGWSESGV